MSKWREETIGGQRLVLADCLEYLPTLAAGSVDCALTDPPYNVGFSYATHDDDMPFYDYLQWQLEVLEECGRLLAPDGNCFYLNYPEMAAHVWAAVSEVIPALVPVEWLTWCYHPHTSGEPLRKASRAWLWFSASGSPYMDRSELLGTYRNPDDDRIQRKMARGERPVDRDWWLYEQVKNVSPEKTGHPCQVPEAMVVRLVRLGCKSGAVVLDPFMGSGTTLVACENTGRRGIGIEICPEYFDIACRRVEKAAAQPRLDFATAPKAEQLTLEAP